MHRLLRLPGTRAVPRWRAVATVLLALPMLADATPALAPAATAPHPRIGVLSVLDDEDTQRQWQPLADRLTLATTATGLILAGALLSRYPWRSVDGYIGQSAWVQLPALIALGALAASLLPAAPPVEPAVSGDDETDTAASTSP